MKRVPQCSGRNLPRRDTIKGKLHVQSRSIRKISEMAEMIGDALVMYYERQWGHGVL